MPYTYWTREKNNFHSFDFHKSFVKFSLFTCQDILLPNFILYEILKSLHHINKLSNTSDSTWCIVRNWFRFLLTYCPFLSQLIFQSYKKVYNLDEHVSSVYVWYIFCLQGVFACSLFHVLELFEIVGGSLGIMLSNIKYNCMYCENESFHILKNITAQKLLSSSSRDVTSKSMEVYYFIVSCILLPSF